MQLLLSIFIGWITLLSRVAAAYAFHEERASLTFLVHLSYLPWHRTNQLKIASLRTNPAPERSPEKMKPATIIGILLILLGIVGFATGGFSFTHRHKDVDAGPIQISHDKKETVPISPILSTVALLGGAGLVAVGARK